MRICSSYISDYSLLRFGPHRWRELVDLGDFGCGQARDQIFQIIKWVEAMPPTTAQQRVNYRTAFSGFGMSNEQKILFCQEHLVKSHSLCRGADNAEKEKPSELYPCTTLGIMVA